MMTAFGLLIALLILRRQLRHDREERTAGRRALVVNQFGMAVAGCMEGLRRQLDETWWSTPFWPDLSRYEQAQEQARVALADSQAFSELERLARDVAIIWRACRNRRRLVPGRSMEAAGTDHRLALLAVLGPLTEDCDQTVRQLVTWAGHGEPPDSKPSDGRIHAPNSFGEQRDRWATFHADRYEQLTLLIANEGNYSDKVRVSRSE